MKTQLLKIQRAAMLIPHAVGAIEFRNACLELNDLIMAELDQQGQPVAAPTRPALNEGEHYAGVILGKDGEADYHLILLPGEAIDINWHDAEAWVAEQGGELPTRHEQSLLFANLQEQLHARCYWSCEEHKEHTNYAWYQSFVDGDQYYNYEDYEYCARAVRRVEIVK